jgi:hypothetical protein
MTIAASPALNTRHREHHAATVSTNRRSRARNVRFYMLAMNVAAMLILSDAYSLGVATIAIRTSLRFALVDP